MSSTGDPLSQLSDATRDTVARLERLNAELAALRGRVAQLEARQEAGLTGALDQGQQIEALRAEVGRLARFEPALAEVHTELARRLDGQRAESQAALNALRSSFASEAERLSRETALQVPRIEALEALPGRLDALDRERGALARAVATAEEHAEAALAERQTLQEDQRRQEQRLAARFEALQVEVRELATELATWRGRLEGQDETVREARAVADHMRDEVARIRDDQHASAEAERLFEQRLDDLLTAARREAAADWARFRRERDADWALLARANEERDERDQTLAAHVEAILGRLDALERDLGAGLTSECFGPGHPAPGPGGGAGQLAPGHGRGDRARGASGGPDRDQRRRGGAAPGVATGATRPARGTRGLDQPWAARPGLRLSAPRGMWTTARAPWSRPLPAPTRIG